MPVLKRSSSTAARGIYGRKRAALLQPLSLACSLALLTSLCGCKRDRVRVYQVPKETAVSPSVAATASTPAPEVKWVTPPGWQEQTPSGMRIADFHIANPAGPPARVSIIPMRGMAGARMDIVNMWRNEVGLKAVDETGPATPSERVPIGNKEGVLYDLVGEGAEGADKTRVVAAMLEDGDQSWFFKMTGPAALVESQGDAFRQFLKSVSFSAPVARAPSAPSAPAATAGGSAPRPKWQVPPGWNEAPPTTMGLARYLVGEQGAQAEMTVTALPGTAGGTLANVNRWRAQQLGLPPVNESELAKLLVPLDRAGPGAMLAEMIGTDVRNNGRPAAMLAAIVQRPGMTWFYKFMGEPSVVAREKNAFVTFVETVDYANGF